MELFDNRCRAAGFRHCEGQRIGINCEDMKLECLSAAR